MVADQGVAGSRRLSVIAAGAGIAGGIALAASLLLWMHYGTAVFFDMIAAGFAACF